MQKFYILLFALSILILGVVYSLIDPSSSQWFPKCPFLMVTGLECPGCGSQRTLHALLNGEWMLAIKQNALVVVAIPYLIIASAALALKSSSRVAERIYNLLTGTIATWIVLLLVVLSFVWRNIC